jgi:photosystem II stability/assembly factor-like uncharacterized protein
MKKIFLIAMLAVAIVACDNNPRTKLAPTGTFGVAFNTDSALTIAQVNEALVNQTSLPVKVKGTVAEYCKGEGCWLTLKNENGEDVFVEVKDKAFVLPHNIEGKTAIANGVASVDTTDGVVQLNIVADGIVLQ